MTYYNINNPSEKESLKNAVLKSITSETGLFMPERIPQLPASFFENLYSMNLQEIAFEVAKAMFSEDIEESALKKIVYEAINFEIPLKALDNHIHVLELFHGPTLAFKDVGARFMAGLFEYFLKDDNQEVTILVATSGDTGGAVADAFYNKKGVNVCILYPSGKVSHLQEKQLTTMGGNIRAIEVKGNFDDCQQLVKQAFSDKELNTRINLTSANSINFARLFPQSFYYFYAVAQIGKTEKPIYISVPSGNFGNLTAGLIAKKMGLNIHTFIASTNSNHAVPDYLETGNYETHPIQFTISNAMDVAKPSNFPRMLALYNQEYKLIHKDILGYWCDDEQTRKVMKELFETYRYIADPHGAIAYDGLRYHLPENAIGVFLESAHPSKFPEEVNKIIGTEIQIPDALMSLMNREKKAVLIENDYQSLLKAL